MTLNALVSPPPLAAAAAAEAAPPFFPAFFAEPFPLAFFPAAAAP
jgi:hypothetical protein